MKGASLKQPSAHFFMSVGIISYEEFLLYITETNHNLPEKAALMTFDDGYIEHYETVFPLLKKFGFSAIFSPVVLSAKRKKVLDVNKIHFILSVAESQINELIEEIFNLLDKYRKKYNLESNEYYYAKLAQPSRFDKAEIIFVKRILQRDLPSRLRSLITDELFKRYVTKDEAGFAAELYMNESQLREMFESGMGIAGHGWQHCWLNAVDSKTQKSEIIRSKEFIEKITGRNNNLIFCYPYGGWDKELLDILRNEKFIAGFTTQVALATDKHNALLLPRVDTNDIPY